MKSRGLKTISLVCLALALVLLDTSFFSFLSVNNASIILSFLVIVIFALKLSSSFYTITFFTIIFFTIFSSVPPWLIVLCFLILPSLVYYLRSSFLPEPSILSVPVYYMLLTSVFDILLLLYAKELNKQGLLSLCYFVLINTIAGIFIYQTISKIQKSLGHSEIKI